MYPSVHCRRFESCIEPSTDKMLAHASVFTLSRYAGQRIGVARDRYEVALLQRFFNVSIGARLIATATALR